LLQLLRSSIITLCDGLSGIYLLLHIFDLAEELLAVLLQQLNLVLELAIL
jgi:hypothetical protein